MGTAGAASILEVAGEDAQALGYRGVRSTQGGKGHMQDRASRTREVILRAAATVFDDRGYVGTRLEDVVDGQGISKGALYFHFPSKEALAAAVVREHYDLWSELTGRLRPEHPRAVRLLIELSRRIAQMLLHQTGVRAGLRLMSERNLIGPSVPRPFVSWVTAVEGLLTEAREQGDLRPDVLPGPTAVVIVSAFAGLPQALAAGAEPADPVGWATALWRSLLPGLVTAPCAAEMYAVLEEPPGG